MYISIAAWYMLPARISESVDINMGYDHGKRGAPWLQGGIFTNNQWTHQNHINTQNDLTWKAMITPGA